MNALSDRLLVLMAIVLISMSFTATCLIYSLANNVPTSAPSEGTGKVAVDIINPKTASNPVTGSGVVSLNIEPLNK